MALKFGPQWLRDLSDAGTGGNGTPQSPTAGTGSFKFKLADYRYGREEMLSLYNESCPPPDQVRKHLTIFSKDIQKPITMMPLTEDEQRLISQGFNSTLVLRQAGRASGPPLRASRGGGTVDRGRGRGRGRGEGYTRTIENGDIGYSRTTHDGGWEQVGRKFERSFSRGYEETGTGTGSSTKREFSRSASDNWRDKRQEEEEEDEAGTWRNSRWGGSSRPNWRDAREVEQENARRTIAGRRGFDHDLRGPRRTSESAENDEVPEWVEDDIEDDPGTFDSKGVFVPTKENRIRETKQDSATTNGNDKNVNTTSYELSKIPEKSSPGDPNKTSSSSHKLHTSHSTDRDSPQLPEPSHMHSDSQRGRPDSIDIPSRPSHIEYSKKGDGDSGFAFPSEEEANGTKAPPGQFGLHNSDELSAGPKEEQTQPPSLQSNIMEMPETDTFSLVDKSLLNLVAEMAADTDIRVKMPGTAIPHNSPTFHKPDSKQDLPVDVAEHALPLSHENAHKWFYRDPQGEVQGPFSNEDMAQWFSAGYFTMSLIVKRGCDDTFKQLGELIKRYGRVPFLPGPPLPPLVTSSASLEMGSSVPPLISPMAARPLPTLVGGALPGVQDPLMYQQLLLQQEYLKQTFMLRQLQMQTVHQMQEQERFKGLTVEQQQQLAMQMTMQSNPITMQHIQQLQQQQLIAQQQHQHKQNDQQRISPPTVPLDGSNLGLSIPSSMPMSSSGSINGNSAPSLSSMPSATKTGEDSGVWGHVQPTSKADWSQPSSLWDVTPGSEVVSPAYQVQLEKLKKEREDARIKEERLRQEALKHRQAELKRQEEELEQQRELMRKEKEDYERQRMLELQKIEESRRQEEERLRRQEDEYLQKQLEEQKRQQLERLEEERRQDELRKQAEEEQKKEKELRKQEEKKKKEEVKKKQQIEEQKRAMEELKKREEERRLHEEMLREQEQIRKDEERIQREEAEMEQMREEAERERLKEEAERERLETQKRQQAELLRQQESLRRLQQAQREQLANIQLPASSNWAAHQQSLNNPVQSKSLMEIQAEEAKSEKEKEKEKQFQMQIQQEKSIMMSQQNQQKSWATHATHSNPKGPSLLDIQQQEQEQEASRKPSKPTQAKTLQMSLGTASTWSNPVSSQNIWSNQGWDSSFGGSSSIWDSPAPMTRTGSGSKKSTVNQSGDFPALRIPSQSGGNKNSSKSNKSKNTKKKEEETVQKLFQNQKQDSFSDWVSQRVVQFSAPIDVPTFVSFMVEVDNPDDVKDYIKTYLGDTKESRDFARQFIEKRSSFRNQARLEKQLEEDSIWGPAPAVNPYIPSRGGNGFGGNAISNIENNDGVSAKSKNRKKKQKMQKLDGSVLGFTVHSDPNRKNAAGELESIQ